MSTFGSDETEDKILDRLDHGDELPSEFSLVEETSGTKRLRVLASNGGTDHEINIDIKDEYISVKYNISDDDSVINIKQEFFETAEDAVEWAIDVTEKDSEF